MMHSTHCIYGYMAYSNMVVRIHMVKDHLDSERGNPLPLLHGLHSSTDRITHTTAFVTPVMERWLGRDIAQWVHHER